MNTIELLAPAKNLETGIAAVNCGADAVYLGAERFGARENAGNRIQDIEKLSEYAHKYWAKIYVTLNTLLVDDELPEALRMIRLLHQAGIDGLIIQDAGLLECDLPPVPLIASTQMHNHTPEKVSFLEKVGFRRVILARELTLQQIEAIRKHTTVELESFIHGSLCVCYSGQCYLSYALGGRSGNRGQCAQPCRHRYSLMDESGRPILENRHLLSIKDLNRSDALGELIRAGITSFKIEGRLKDKTYVMNIVAYYRKRLDVLLKENGLKKSSSGKSILDFSPNPDKTFNRGYTDYDLHGRGKPLTSIYTPKSTGEQIGRVVTVERGHFTLDSEFILHSGDGICFFDQNMELNGTHINRIEGNSVFPQKISGIRPGTLIHRNEDAEFSRLLKNSKSVRKIGVSMIFAEMPNGFSLEIVDEDGNPAQSFLNSEKPIAEKKQAAADTLRKQLFSLGGTEFETTELDVQCSDTFFIPVSDLNALRRTVIEKLTLVRQQNRPIGQGQIIINNIPYPEKKLTYLGNVLNRKAEAFYRRHGVSEIEPAAESGLDMRNRKVMTTRHCILDEQGKCLKKIRRSSGSDCFYIKNEAGRKFRLHFNCDACEMELIFWG